MTEDQNYDQEVELHADVDNEVVEEAHDPKNAEAQSVASVDKAGEATGSAKKRKGDKTNKDPMPKTKTGMINAAYTKMSKMKREDLSVMLSKMMAEDVDADEGSVTEDNVEFQYEADFSQDLNALISDEATLSEEFKTKAETIFEAAITSKLSEEIDRLEAKFDEELNEAIESTQSDLVEKVDSYLNYVVEQWMAENQVAIQAGLRAEVAENFMSGLKDLFTETYIEVPESKVDLVDDLADTVEELEEQLNQTTGQAIQMAEELEAYKRDFIIREASRDLAETQVEKLKSLCEDTDFDDEESVSSHSDLSFSTCEDTDFDDEESFAKKVVTVRDSYFTKQVSESKEAAYSEQEDGDSPVQTSGSMSSYLQALEKTKK